MIAARGLAALAFVLLAFAALGADGPRGDGVGVVANGPAVVSEPPPAGPLDLSAAKLGTTLQTVVVFGLASLAPAAILMVTAFVRISVVLTLLRQALGNPQVPGNQVVMALSLLLTALVMRPQAEAVYHDAIRPLMEEKITPLQAWEAGSQPIKEFMVLQIHRAGHERYLLDLYEYAEPASPGVERPTECEQLPLRVVAPAFLMSELTTALVIGFAVYLPFLVIDLVVSSVLAAMGLVMLPPSLVAPPLKLIVFVLAGGWWLVAAMLLRSFGLGADPGIS